MQILHHKNASLTICQRFFIEKSLELLHFGSIDSYRVRLHNPKTILEEIKFCLQEFQKGNIKHFETISSSTNSGLINEAISLLENDPNYLDFTSFTQKFLVELLRKTKQESYKKTISSIEILLLENENYLTKTIDGVQKLLESNNSTLFELEKIDFSLNILFSELISMDFSKRFLYKLIYGIFVNTLKSTSNFNDHFLNFRSRLLMTPSDYEVIFRIDTSQKVYDSISAIPSAELNIADDINDFNLKGKHSGEFVHFNVKTNTRKFIRCKINTRDYFAALKKSRSVLSEYLDVINLGLSDEQLQIHNRVLVIDLRSPEKAQFQTYNNILDGSYKVALDHYQAFALKLPSILRDEYVQSESKEKIKSAIRYLRLGNQSTEVEHKFINYWIGLEYIFSNYDSPNTIFRVKEHFINAHALAYVKRNTHGFKKDFAQISWEHITLISEYLEKEDSYLRSKTFFEEIGIQLLNHYPLLSYRAQKLDKWFFQEGKSPNAHKYLEKHTNNLRTHFTRIYRLRNKIIHDAATNTNDEHIVSNLRYYLTFILNELIDYFSRTYSKQISIEDYFILNEIKMENIALSGYQLDQLLDVDCSIDFIS
jgi:hypothetical protein